MVDAACLILLSLLLLLSTSPVAAQEGSLRGLDEYIIKSMADWGTPGLSIAIVRDDSVIYAKGYGVRELGKPDRVDENTLFAIGSQTKPFTTAALSILADDRKISWDDRVTARLPGFRLADPIATDELTIRDLASHRSGLPANNMIFWGTNLSRKEIVERVRYLQPTARIRTRFQYSNLMYITAGEIIPAVTGKSWDDFVRERIFAPLGMTRSETSVPALLRSGKPNVATPHVRPPGGQTVVVPWLDLDNAGPAGSIISSAAEMAQWLRMQLGKGSYNGKQIISERMVEEMRSPQMIIPRSSNMVALPGINFVNYGLGWVVHEYHNDVVVQHGGQTDAMRSIGLMVPERKIAVVVLANEGLSELPSAIAYNVVDRLLGVPIQDWSTIIYRRTQSPPGGGGGSRGPQRVEGTRPSLELDKYAGTYRNQMYGDAQVSVRDGTLTLQILGLTAPLEHWHYDTFRFARSGSWTPVNGQLITFSLDRNAEVTYLHIPAAGPATGIGSFVRVPQR
jgi:CubicO group peptidase (beta-lactamase class C family)